ncbi:hypothetical protein LLEC1_07021 [Akanthomyces lecanii]|uniref:Sterol 24-C-methyltransferase n=1 Tax=Cordyceps confragosa TaxID=2714763 RepID=A0A179IT92_CORDF|nr:hypothetical protein LLEC1_07021 [Akanthomyces lecanii]
MTSQALLRVDDARNSAFDKALHGESGKGQGGIRAMMSKDKTAQAAAVDEYFQHWDNKTAEDETSAVRQSRTDDYASITRQYYNLATDFYEYAWGGSFHFCRFTHGEPFKQAIARHEHFIATQIGIKRNMKVLDMGCGVGGPARQISSFTGCHVTGININQYQVDRATMYAQKHEMADNLEFVQGDFMSLPFPDNSFDAVYSIEATCHAPSLADVYTEIFRVLKPGGVFGVYEWLMTDDYDNDNMEHRKLRLDIEQGDGIAQLFKIADGKKAMEAAGFELQISRDLAEDVNSASPPWYWPLGSDLRYASTIWDALTVLRMNRWGRVVAHNIFGLLETLRIAPPGTKKTADSLGQAADALVKGGRERLFTPMYLMVGRKAALSADGE